MKYLTEILNVLFWMYFTTQYQFQIIYQQENLILYQHGKWLSVLKDL